MHIIRTFLMAMSMYSAIPVPVSVWRDDCYAMVICGLPAVGAVFGGIWALAAWACMKYSVPAPIFAFLLAALPLVLTGFFHLDGFLDTCDAVLSRRDRERRLEILKDSRVGAFAVISFGILLLGQYAAGLTLAESVFSPRDFILVPAATRMCASIAVTYGRPLPHSQYTQREVGRGKTTVLIIEAVLILACSAMLGMGSLVLTLGAVGFYCLALGYAAHDLGGVSGDLSGFAQTIAECAAMILGAIVLTNK